MRCKHFTCHLCQDAESGWVIEAGDSNTSSPLYFAGYIKFGEDTTQRWSFDPLEAIRFARASDAAKISSWLYTPMKEHRICEHQWG